MTRPGSEGFEYLKRPQTLVGMLLAGALLWFGFALPLAFALGIHLAISRLIRKLVGEDPRASDGIWGFAALFSLLLITCLHFALLTRGIGEILGPELLSGSFDSLAQGFLRGTLFLAETSMRGPLRGRAQDIATVLMFAVAVSAVVTISSTLSAIPLGGPAHSSSYKAEWQERFRAVDARMPG
ncbi:MAG: hypothetical protein JRG89_07310 [Deltaproteobacteria bacterium]|nr:hypothetical protein [Deltaproteobacteria bacterium]MBW2723477.1 hypothetical protein [Deltaproteobacteria bacterium]